MGFNRGRGCFNCLRPENGLIRGKRPVEGLGLIEVIWYSTDQCFFDVSGYQGLTLSLLLFGGVVV